MNYITKLSLLAQGLLKCPKHNLIARCLEQLSLKGLTNIVKIQDVIALGTRWNEIMLLPKRIKKFKGFLQNNYIELIQKMLNLKFMCIIKQISLKFGACISVY